jgi:hypothetical protein
VPNKIKPKRSYTANAVPTTSDLDANELAINWADGKAFTKNAAGNIVSVTLGGGGGGGSGLTWSSVPASAFAEGTAGQIAYDSSFFYVAVAQNKWERTPLSIWTPVDSIAGLQAWYDASDASTLFDATTGGSLVAADGAVARWQDKSGNNRHFTQATSNKRPLRKTAQQNGFDLLRFDGSNDNMTVSGSASSLKFLHSADSTIFVVYNWTETTQTLPFLLATAFNDGSVDGSVGAGIRLRNDFGAATPYAKLQWLAIGTGNGTRINSYTGDNSYPLSSLGLLTLSSSVGASAEADRSVFRRNGVVRSKTNAADNSSVNTANSTYDLQLCTEGAVNGLFAKADIAEIIIYNAVLSDANRAAVESYLMSKWAIT